MKIFDLIMIGLILFMVYGCGNTNEPARDPIETPALSIQETQSGNNQVAGEDGMERKFHRTFSIEMPKGWKELEYQNMIFYLPPGSEAVDPISEKVQVIAAGVPQDNKVPLKEILEAGLDDSKKLVPDLVMVKEEDIKLDNADAIRMVFTGSIQGKKFENVQISTLNNDIILHVIHNCFEDSCNNSVAYDKMVESFQIIPQERRQT